MKNLLLGLALGAGLSLSALGQAVAEDIDLTFLLVNDTYKMGTAEDTRGGFGKINALARAERAKGGNLVYAHAGDAISPSLLSGFDKGEHIIALTNVVAPDIFVPGNHEFDFGKEIFFKRMSEVKSKILAANLRNADGKKIEGIEDTMMVTYGDASDPLKSVKIGYVGLTADNSDVKSNPEDLQISDTVKTGKKEAKKLREDGADLIVAIVHADRATDQKLFNSHDYDIILTGDDHDLALFFDGKTAMVESKEEGEYLTAVDLKISVTEKRGKRRVKWWPNFRIMDTADVTPDAETMQLVDGYQKTLSKELDIPLGSTASLLDSRKAAVRSGETAIGNLIADAMRKEVGADVTITNGGGIRGNKVYEPGTKLSRRDILTELPFGNKTILMEVSGKTILKALENGFSQVENTAGRFPHVSGMTVTYDPNAKAGDRVKKVKINGKKLKKDKTYKLATNDYMARGGDGYKALKKGKIILGDLDGKLMANAVMAYIREAGAVNAKVEGRIKSK
jgi:2',3'-cyclic-nucleotide 2'-phosphodiesterase (5'-nucleotidase family)